MGSSGNNALSMAAKSGSRPSLTTEFIGDQIVTTISASQNQLDRDNVTRISVKRTKTPEGKSKKSNDEKGKKPSKKDKKEKEKEVKDRDASKEKKNKKKKKEKDGVGDKDGKRSS